MNVNELAQKLRDAQTNKVLIKPLRNDIGVDDIQLAYTIQELNIEERIKQGAEIVGKKIGLTSTVVQKQLGCRSTRFRRITQYNGSPKWSID